MKNSGKIGIDIRLWSHPGIGRYLRELVGAMGNRRNFEDFHFLGYQKDLELLRMKKAGVSCQKVTSGIYSVAEQWEMARRAESLPLLHVPHFNIPVCRQGKLVVTVHDLIYLHDAAASKSRWGKPYVEFLFREIQKKASAILAVSEYTKADLLNRFPKISSEKVYVTHEAASSFFQPGLDAAALEAAGKKYHLEKPFVLFVGSLKEHKNIPLLIEAVKQFRTEKKIDADLVIVGRRDMKNEGLWRRIQENRVFVRYLGELTDADLATLYQLARVFVLPSLREGFGLPALEAMASGVPVIVSNRASLPEIAGNAGLVFDPERVDELTALLYNVFSDGALRERLSIAGIARAKEFSWEETAQKTLAVYQKVLA